jgi:hypothetical protein
MADSTTRCLSDSGRCDNLSEMTLIADNRHDLVLTRASEHLQLHSLSLQRPSQQVVEAALWDDLSNS